MLADREVRGYSILAKGDLPKAISEETFLVPSQSSDRKYRVTLHKRWTCDCPDFKYRHEKCKHIHSVEFLLKMRAKSETLPLDYDILQKASCLYCKSQNIKKNGTRKNQNVVKQRYLCLDCKKTFIEDSEFARIQADPKIVTLSMDLYFKGLSLREIADTLKQFYGIEMSHQTISNWIGKFTRKIDEYTRGLKPETSEAWHIDEQMVKTKGKFVYMWNVLDEGTRFLLASNITKGRQTEDAREVIQKAKMNTESKPRFVVTDGLNSYDDAIRKEFSTTKAMRPKYMLPETTHVKLKTIRTKPNNNHVERFHGTFRERDKVMRGFKGGEQVFADGFRNYYNFIREHTSLGMTPAQASGVDLRLGMNKWLSLIKRSI